MEIPTRTTADRLAARTQVIALVGPTGTGKSELALALAERVDAEIVNCDSRQIYRGLDIGSAKPSADIRRQVPHHLFDVAAPDQPFDCARYAEMARSVLTDIGERGRIALVVGGTGLYLKALRFGLFAGPPRDDELRRELAAEESARPGSLHRALGAVDPVAAARLHPHDHPRLIRALEVYRLTGAPLSQWHAAHRFAGGELPMAVVGMRLQRPLLYARLDSRCNAMVESGLVDEVRGLLAAGYSPALPSLQSIGYREVASYLAGELDLTAAVDAMARATRRFAKRQMTWFRADPTIRWLDADGAGVDCVVAALRSA